MHVVYLVLRDPRIPWYCKAVAACAAGYALSPITLIPDWVPVIGFVDNVLVLGLGIWLVKKLAPTQVMLEVRRQAAKEPTESKSARAAVTKTVVGAIVATKIVLALVFTGAVVALLRHV
jgi:uncharacterized membrane protein YkvA (DUF1232 family)